MQAVGEVLPGVHQLAVAGSSVFLVVEDPVAIIDAGGRRSGRRILGELSRLGRRPQDVCYLVATHHHPDHIGGLAYLRQNSAGRVAVHEHEAAYVKRELAVPSPFQHRVLASLTKPLIPFVRPPQVSVDLVLRDGDELNVLGGMRILHNPGHTPGSISLYFPQSGLLIVGDALEHRRGRLGLPSSLFSVDLAEAKRSIRRLAELEIEVLAFSHFPPIRRGAGQALRAFASSLG